MRNKIQSFVHSVRERGLANALGGTIDQWRRRITDWLQDRRYGIETGGRVLLKDLGIDDDQSISYEASRFRHFRQLMRVASLRCFDGAFLDVGSGKGRAVVLAATYPFRRVIGMEISEQLQATARQNVDRARARLRCKQIELITCDAAEHEIPDDAIAIYFFNPFYASVLARCLEHIRESLLRHPRDLTILCLLPKRDSKFARHIAQVEWLTIAAELEFEKGHYGVVYRTGTPAT